MSGRDTAAHFKGLIIGAIFIGAVIVTTKLLTDKKFEGHTQPTVEATH